jgi:K+-sensing histidine kinase KdpD
MITDPGTRAAALASAAPTHLEWPYRRSAGKRYGVAILAIVVAFAIRYLIYGDLQNRLVFTFFVPAAMVAVWYGGAGPGILATVLGLALGDYFFLLSRTALWPLGNRESMALGVYSVTTLLCVALCERLHVRIRDFERALDFERHHRGELPAAAREFADYLMRYYALATHHSYSYPSWPYRRSFVTRYGVAAGVVIVAFASRYWLFGTQDLRFPFLFFVPAAMVAVWYGGMLPGLLAAVMGLMLGDYFFLSAHEAMGVVREYERIQIGLFAVATTFCVMLLENLHERIRRVEHAFDHARHHHHVPHADVSASASSAITPPAG